MASLPTFTIAGKNLPTTNVQEQYFPPNWSAQKALYAITFQGKQDTQQTDVPKSFTSLVPTESSGYYKFDNPAISAGRNPETQMNMFVFDAIKRAQHRQIATVTQHPLQVGFNISDHVTRQPAMLTLEVGMSDAIQSYKAAGFTPMWAQNPSKSVSAYQQMLQLMDIRQIMDINTRLQTYFHMVLVEISVEDTIKTYFGGLSMVLTFQQVFVADVAESFDSARIQTSGDTTQGTVQPQPPSTTVQTQHKINFNPFANQTIITAPGGIPQINIPGAGNWTSNIISGTKDWFKSIGSF